jgi:hypothetical protein
MCGQSGNNKVSLVCRSRYQGYITRGFGQYNRAQDVYSRYTETKIPSSPCVGTSASWSCEFRRGVVIWNRERSLMSCVQYGAPLSMIKNSLGLGVSLIHRTRMGLMFFIYLHHIVARFTCRKRGTIDHTVPSTLSGTSLKTPINNNIYYRFLLRSHSKISTSFKMYSVPEWSVTVQIIPDDNMKTALKRYINNIYIPNKGTANGMVDIDL